MDLDKYITEAFQCRWHGQHVTDSLDEMKRQLYKNLTDQTNGYWSGSSAYGIMVDYGFLIDAKFENHKPKKLTKLGELFFKQFESSDLFK